MKPHAHWSSTLAFTVQVAKLFVKNQWYSTGTKFFTWQSPALVIFKAAKIVHDFPTRLGFASNLSNVKKTSFRKSHKSPNDSKHIDELEKCFQILLFPLSEP